MSMVHRGAALQPPCADAAPVHAHVPRRYRVSENFGTVIFGKKGPVDAVSRLSGGLDDPDPVPIPAKWLDYAFCCNSMADPSSCTAFVGGANTTMVRWWWVPGWLRASHRTGACTLNGGGSRGWVCPSNCTARWLG
jgi:hypothetical protein